MKELEVYMSLNVYSKIKDFANKTVDKMYNPNYRDWNQKYNNILHGKLAEFLLYFYYKKQFTYPDLEIYPKYVSDAGFDLKYKDKTIDVKVFYNRWINIHQKPKKLNADYYAIVQNIRYDLKSQKLKGTFYGYLTNDEIKNNLRESAFHGYYLDPNKLKFINEKTKNIY